MLIRPCSRMIIFGKHRSSNWIQVLSHTTIDAMLVLLLLIHAVYGRDFSDSQLHLPIFRNISTCPEEGYILRSELGEDLREQCHLCFCEGDGVATCWKHQNSGCDAKNYVHDKKIRSRRNPGFADLFFQDAARDMFQKQTPEVCKPFQSSYSVGCPPADWCIGCTVCDCNANGRWDCHVLSFCPGDKDKKRVKKRRTVINAMKPSLRIATPNPKTTTKKPIPTKPTLKRTMPTKRPARKYMPVQSKMKGTPPTKPMPRKYSPTQSKIKETVPIKVTTKQTMANQFSTKKTVTTKPKTKNTIQTNPAVKKTIETNTAVKKIMKSKPANKRTATKRPVQTITVNKLNKAREIDIKSQKVNKTKIKPNHMMQINTKPRKETPNKANNSPQKKSINLAKPVQKKTLSNNFQKVSGKPMRYNVNRSKAVTNTTILGRNVSSKVMKSTEKIINDDQKKLSKLINIIDKQPPKKKIVKNNFKTVQQKNSTIIEINKKIKEKVISDRKYGVVPKRLNRNKRYTDFVFRT